MDHADSVLRLIVDSAVHVGKELRDGDGVRDVVGDGEEGLLVHLAGVGVVAAEVFDLALHLFQESRVDDTGVAVIFDEEKRPLGVNGVQLFAADKRSLFDGIRRGAEGDERLGLCSLGKVVGPVQDLLIGLGLHDVEAGVKCGKTCKVLMGVDKGRGQSFAAQFHGLSALVLFRE